MASIWTGLAGKKTYIAAALLAAYGLLTNNWSDVLQALAVFGLRNAIQ